MAFHNMLQSNPKSNPDARISDPFRGNAPTVPERLAGLLSGIRNSDTTNIEATEGRLLQKMHVNTSLRQLSTTKADDLAPDARVIIQVPSQSRVSPDSKLGITLQLRGSTTGHGRACLFS